MILILYLRRKYFENKLKNIFEKKSIRESASRKLYLKLWFHLCKKWCYDFFFFFLGINLRRRAFKKARRYLIQKPSGDILRTFYIWAVFLKNSTIILPNFLVWKYCGKAQFLLSFGWFQQWFQTSAVQKLCLSKNFTHKEIRWKYSILRSGFLQKTPSRNLLPSVKN